VTHVRGALTLCHAVFDDRLIEVIGEADPSARDWDALLATCRREIATLRGGVVLSDGGRPNAKQRAALAALDGAVVRIAVLTPSVLARGAVTALHWLGHNIRAFEPDDLDSAFAYIDVPAASYVGTLRRIVELKAELAGVVLDPARLMVDLRKLATARIVDVLRAYPTLRGSPF
jgi:hypothetical protein